MKKWFKDFIDYYKNVGIVKIILFLLCIALFILEFNVTWDSVVEYFEYFRYNLRLIIIRPIIYGYNLFYPIIIPLLFILQIIFKKIDKKFLFIDYFGLILNIFLSLIITFHGIAEMG